MRKDAEDQLDEEEHKVRSRWTPFFCPCRVGVYHPPILGCVHQSRDSLKSVCWDSYAAFIT